MPKKILSIDDEQVIRMIIQLHLGGAGYDVTVTESGKEGIDLASSGAFDLILCDIKLRDESGIDVIKALKNMHCNIPVVAATGFIGDKILAMVREAGAVDYIAKPFTKQALLSIVAKHI
jgi:CheY-like chemotaxis protein